MTLFSGVKKAVDTYYDAASMKHCNTCHVGAWVVCREAYLIEKSGEHSMKTFFKRFGRNRKEMVTEAPLTTEAVRCDQPECKILVVCRGRSFSRGIADYAISMASKTRSSLVALNLDESGRDFAAFSDEARKNIEYFSCKASDAGLNFSHEVRQGKEGTVVAQLHEKEPFRYVMDDSAAVCQSRSTIPVYTRATLQAK
ncbi:hypothetical protein SAMN02745704_02057 [Paucidesulfovibrio gracilis DSM 16080]|uniref:Uncharacterized protein n=1 Tax=Paucidesulfovibrio gracilis DSM 16080 TaxID=1121449 RepID=A0A1T4XDX6_9BACT|nr:universal stress protein [Paucidesulfovibrio gracilis]SKA87597.1 hypothetical protein SAMN02745704_02057 [Paucidesulfovibrio gracilis DSM 16080]